MKLKSVFCLFLCAVMALSLAACSTSGQTAESGEATALPEISPTAQPVTGTGEATAQGFGGPVTVTVTVTDGVITDVTATGANETEGVGTNALDLLPGRIVEANSVEVDGVSGATYSSTAVLTAAKQAYDQATGAAEAGTSMVPGVYSATVNGFGGPLSVNVEVSEKAILNVEVTEASETQDIGTVAIERIPAGIVENQTTGVDTVTGASITTNAIKSAVRGCLAQAGASETDFAAVVAAEKSDEATQYTCDVVICGSGLAGLSAAVRAGELGLNAIVIEKLSITGGCAKTSLGSFMVCEVEENRSLHITDEHETLDAALARWRKYQDTSMRQSDVYPDYDRLSHMLVETMFTLDWLSSFEVNFTPKTKIADRGMAMVQVNVPGIEAGTGAGKLLTQLRLTAEKMGIQIYCDTPATGNLCGQRHPCHRRLCRQCGDGLKPVPRDRGIQHPDQPGQHRRRHQHGRRRGRRASGGSVDP